MVWEGKKDFCSAARLHRLMLFNTIRFRSRSIFKFKLRFRSASQSLSPSCDRLNLSHDLGNPPPASVPLSPPKLEGVEHPKEQVSSGI